MSSDDKNSAPSVQDVIKSYLAQPLEETGIERICDLLEQIEHPFEVFELLVPYGNKGLKVFQHHWNRQTPQQQRQLRASSSPAGDHNALILSVIHTQVEWVKSLLAKKFDPTWKDPFGKIALHFLFSQVSFKKAHFYPHDKKEEQKLERECLKWLKKQSELLTHFKQEKYRHLWSITSWAGLTAEQQHEQSLQKLKNVTIHNKASAAWWTAQVEKVALQNHLAPLSGQQSKRAKM